MKVRCGAPVADVAARRLPALALATSRESRVPSPAARKTAAYRVPARWSMHDDPGLQVGPASLAYTLAVAPRGRRATEHAADGRSGERVRTDRVSRGLACGTFWDAPPGGHDACTRGHHGCTFWRTGRIFVALALEVRRSRRPQWPPSRGAPLLRRHDEPVCMPASGLWCTPSSRRRTRSSGDHDE